MPIRPEFRHLYRGPAWRATRERIRARAGDRCEQCGKPNRTRVFVATEWEKPKCMAGKHRVQFWLRVEPSETFWRDHRGKLAKDFVPRTGLPRQIWVVCCVSHVNHVPGDDRDENLRFWCQWCHLHHDREQHHLTRSGPKDAARPLLAEGARA
jgi:hypothetical protein